MPNILYRDFGEIVNPSSNASVAKPIQKWVLNSFKRKFPNLKFVQQPPVTILNEIKEKLKSLNIENLSEVGNYNMNHDLKVQTSGLYANINFLKKLSNTNITSTSIKISQWKQTQAVLIADTLDLRDKTIDIDLEKVSELIIIAEKIIASNSATITYSPLTNPKIGQNGVYGTNGINLGTSCQNGHGANDGGNGQNGQSGKAGPDGLDAPSIKIFVLEIDSIPDIILPGQKGAKGGNGGQGGDGGQGERGRSASGSYNPLKVFCTRDRGSGGDGGDGGNGGKGGRGGHGGDGGMITIATLQDQVTSLITSQSFIIDTSGGDGGEPGIQGEPGIYGKGGKKGCDDTLFCDGDEGKNGVNGQNGIRTGNYGSGNSGVTSNITFSTITKNDWNLKLEQPYISRLEDNQIYAGDDVIIHGMNFVDGNNGSLVYINGTKISSIYNNDKQITFNIPQNSAAGIHEIYVKTIDGDISNKINLFIKPYITAANISGDTLEVNGNSFSTSPTLLYDGESLELTTNSKNEILGIIPEKIGFYAGGEIEIEVVNKDGFHSNKMVLQAQAYLNNGFKANPNGWQFENYSNGIGGLNTFSKVFGADEIAFETIWSPIFTPLYFAFFHNFLKSNGHCTGMSLCALNEFYKGNQDLYYDYPVNTQSIKKLIDIAQGRLLSHELLVHYGDQIDEGVSRVEKTLREIETYLNNSSNSDNARTLSFIPSGSIFDADAIKVSHTVVPTKLVYAQSSYLSGTQRSLDGAKLYIYDNNHPNNNDLYLDIYEINGTLHYSYGDYSSESGTSPNSPMTLGTWTLKKQLFDDVDLPLNIPFIVDILLSPAYIQVTDENNNILGYKDGNIYMNKELGYISAWTDKIILTKPDITLEKSINGYDNGNYTYMTKHPSGNALVLNDVLCSTQTKDFIKFYDDGKNISVYTNENKNIDLSLITQDLSNATTIHDVKTKELVVSYQAITNKKIQFEFDNDDITIKCESDLAVDIKSRLYNSGGEIMHENQLSILTIPTSRKLCVTKNFWDKDTTYLPTLM